MGSERVDVSSADGATLAAEVLGSGSPLVLVHGTAIGRSAWLRLPELLGRRHTVWSYDRRGRGDSADAPDYAFEREIDDVRAVLAAVGEPAHLVGHSFGAVCAMEAAVAGAALRSLVLYEPPVHVARGSAAGVRRVAAQLDAGDADSAVATFLVEVAGMTPAELEGLRAMPDAWNATVEHAPTIRREIEALARLAWDPVRFASLNVPTLHIAGELTDGPAYPTHDDIAAALPHASHVTIAGQGHVAFAEDPESFAEIVLGFTAQHER